jgi:hypothetical protein
MADLVNIISFKNLLNEIMVTYSYNDAERRKVGMFLIESIKHHRLFHLPEKRNIIETTVGDNNDVDMPNDCLEFISLSINHKNRYWTFTKNDKLIVHTDGGNPEVLDIGVNGIEIAEDGAYFSLGERGGKNRFYYVPDFKNDRVFVNGDLQVNQKVYLTYISSGIDTVAGQTVIPVKWKDVIKKHVRYLVSDASDVQEYAIRRHKDVYEEARDMNRNLNWTMDELADVIYKTNTQAPKRKVF